MLFRSKVAGTSLAVQWLRLCLAMQGVRVQSLVGELRSHMPCGQNTKTWNRSNIVTNSIKTLKWSMSKRKKNLIKKEKEVRQQIPELKVLDIMNKGWGWRDILHYTVRLLKLYVLLLAIKIKHNICLAKTVIEPHEENGEGKHKSVFGRV